jgi:hypothetical protein
MTDQPVHNVILEYRADKFGYVYTCAECGRHVEFVADKQGDMHMHIDPPGDQNALHQGGASLWDTGLTMTAEAEPKEELGEPWARWEPKGGWKL